MKVRVTNIQRFSLHDGNGIRTVIFFKGCSLKCPWCCNPENIDYKFNYYFQNGVDKCFGYDIEIDDLYKIIIKDKSYYDESNGGVTFSGGEPLLQYSKCKDLIKKLNNDNISINIETSLNVDKNIVKDINNIFDYYYVDIKSFINKNTCLDEKKYIDNFDILWKDNKDKIILRFPVNYEYTLHPENIKKIYSFIKKHEGINVQIFKTHNLAESKYKLLNKNFVEFKDVADNVMNDIKQNIEKNNGKVIIMKL